MGIQGLLPFLANSTRDCHISEFENQYVAVDTYCWLHKGIYSCSYELAMKKPTTKYVTYCMRYIEMLRHFKVKPILVFDGRNLSSKEETERKRREERNKKRKRGLELIRAGKTNEGRQLLGESVDVGHELVVNLMKECRKMNVDCIVAPYEADAQLSYLSLQKVVSCVISEDSDLLVYGCERVMFKMDKSGRGKLVEKDLIYMSLGMDPEEYKEEKFRYMCILSGCDYLPSLPSIGPANALKFVKLLNDKDILETLPRLPIYLNKTKITVNPEYIVRFKIADNTFKHQLVYDSFQRMQVPLTPVTNEDDIVGEKLPEDEAFQLAVGNVDPVTMKVMDFFDPDKGQGFDLLWKSVASATAKALHEEGEDSLLDCNQFQSRKRCSEVTLVKSELKKYCVSPAPAKLKSLQRRNTICDVPVSSFEFKAGSQKITANKSDSKSFLRSRYFSWADKPKKEPKEPLKEDKSSLRKDESYEDYLRRIYDEQVSDAEQNNEEISPKIRSPPENTKSNNAKDAGILSRQHSLLDEICKGKKDEIPFFIPSNSLNDVSPTDDVNKSLKELPNLEKLTVNTPVSSSQGSLDEEDVEIPDLKKIIEVDKKEDEIAEAQTMDLIRRSPSPVFKIFSKSKSHSESIIIDKYMDTTNTCTSVYFSPLFNSPTGNSNSAAESFRNSSLSSKKSTLKFIQKTNKNLSKNQAAGRTLFQFGFKKE